MILTTWAHVSRTSYFNCLKRSFLSILELDNGRVIFPGSRRRVTHSQLTSQDPKNIFFWHFSVILSSLLLTVLFVNFPILSIFFGSPPLNFLLAPYSKRLTLNSILNDSCIKDFANLRKGWDTPILIKIPFVHYT